MQEQHAFKETKSALDTVRHAIVCRQLNHSNNSVLVLELHWTQVLPHALRLILHLFQHYFKHKFSTWAQ